MEELLAVGLAGALSTTGAVVAWVRAKQREKVLERRVEGLRAGLEVMAAGRASGRDRLREYLARKMEQRGT